MLDLLLPGRTEVVKCSLFVSPDTHSLGFARGDSARALPERRYDVT